MPFTIIEGDVVLRDENGNPVGVVLDGAVYRLQTEAKVRGAGPEGAPPTGDPVYVAGINTDGNLEPLEMAPGGGMAIGAHLATAFVPRPSDVAGRDVRQLLMDSTGALRTRSQVLTDEGVFKDPFHGTTLESNLTGTLTFTNGSQVVFGSGTSFTTELTKDDYLRNSVDGQADYVRVLVIVDDTVVILADPYGGTGGGGATGVRSWWIQDVVGGTISVVSSEVTLSPDTASGNRAAMTHGLDYLPLVGEFRCRISQRIADQEAVAGFVDQYPSPEIQAVVLFDGTDATKVTFRTSTSSAAVNITETVVDLTDLDLTFTSAQSLNYRIALQPETAVLSIADVEVATHTRGVPGPYDTLAVTAAISNSGTVTSTDFVCSRLIAQSVNQIAVASPIGEVRVRQGTANVNDNAWPTKLVSVEGNDASFGEDGRLSIGHSYLHFYDQFENATVNTTIWTQDQSGMAQVQANGSLTLNSGGSTTADAYSTLTGAKRVVIINEYATNSLWRARVVAQDEANISFGYGIASGTAAVPDGAFFRFNNGQLWGVAAFGGAETLVEFDSLPISTDFYAYEITVFENRILFSIRSNDGKFAESVTLQLSATQSAFFESSHLPLFARVFNENPGPSAAAQLVLGQAAASQLDVNMQKPWSEQLAGTGLGAIVNPNTHAQTTNYVNNTAPVSAVLSNTTPSYTTLGGLFQFDAPTGAETDYALFGFQVPIPPGRTLYVWSVVIAALNLGASVNNATPTAIQWAIAANSSGASLATGAPNPPIKTAVGIQSVNKGATAGDPYQPPILTYTPRTPLVVFPGRYLHVIARVISGVATTNQIVRGTVTVEGYFE